MARASPWPPSNLPIQIAPGGPVRLPISPGVRAFAECRIFDPDIRSKTGIAQATTGHGGEANRGACGFPRSPPNTVTLKMISDTVPEELARLTPGQSNATRRGTCDVATSRLRNSIRYEFAVVSTPEVYRRVFWLRGCPRECRIADPRLLLSRNQIDNLASEQLLASSEEPSEAHRPKAHRVCGRASQGQGRPQVPQCHRPR